MWPLSDLSWASPYREPWDPSRSRTSSDRKANLRKQSWGERPLAVPSSRSPTLGLRSPKALGYLHCNAGSSPHFLLRAAGMCFLKRSSEIISVPLTRLWCCLWKRGQAPQPGLHPDFISWHVLPFHILWVQTHMGLCPFFVYVSARAATSSQWHFSVCVLLVLFQKLSKGEL